MTDRNWNPDNFKFEFPDIPPYEGTLVGMPMQHKIQKIRIYFTVDIIGEIYRCLNAKAELAGLILCLVAIDYLSGFYVGRQSTGKDFRVFVERYLPMEYKPFINDIYTQLRNGLLHNLAILNPWHGRGTEFIIQSSSSNHLQQDKNGKVIFSVNTFCEDIRRAFWMYIYDLIMKADVNPNLLRNFQKRFNKLDGQGALMERVSDSP